MKLAPAPFKWIFTTLFLSSFSVFTFATTPGPYLGLQFGWGRVNQGEFVTEYINKVVKKILPETSLHSIIFTDTGRGGRFFVGYQFNAYIAAEIGYYRFSSLDYKASLNTDIRVFQKYGYNIHLPINLFAKIYVRTEVIDVVAKGILPLTDYFSIYGKLGVAVLNSDATAAVTAKTPLADVDFYAAPSVNIVYPTFGLGINYDATKHISLDLALMRIQKVNSCPYPNIDFIAVGIVYHL